MWKRNDLNIIIPNETNNAINKNLKEFIKEGNLLDRFINKSTKLIFKNKRNLVYKISKNKILKKSCFDYYFNNNYKNEYNNLLYLFSEFSHSPKKYIYNKVPFPHELGISYLIIDYINGYPLSNLLADNYFIDYNYLLRLIYKISILHKLEIIHLDIKPGNIILNKKDITLIDFGESYRYKNINELKNLKLFRRGSLGWSLFNFKCDYCNLITKDWIGCLLIIYSNFFFINNNELADRFLDEVDLFFYLIKLLNTIPNSQTNSQTNSQFDNNNYKIKCLISSLKCFLIKLITISYKNQQIQNHKLNLYHYYLIPKYNKLYYLLCIYHLKVFNYIFLKGN